MRIALGEAIRLPEIGEIWLCQASWRDAWAVWQLEKICFPLDAWPIWDVLAALTFPAVVRLKAEHGERLVGFLAADVRRREDVTWIATVGVHPDYRQRGLGRALMQAAEARVATSHIRLSVRRSNRAAIHLYRSLGYVEVDVWPAYYHGGEDAVVMGKKRL